MKNALTHSSYANEHNLPSYERLEFLGDAILGFTAAEMLFNEVPEIPEGKMSALRAQRVCENTLKKVAVKLNIPENMLIGKGEEKTGGRHRASILADMVESIIAAIYLDGGLEEAKKFIYEYVLSEEPDIVDNKSALQQLAQKNGQCEIKYLEDEEYGPDHDKTFVFSVYLEGVKLGSGSGRSKQQAEQSAAGDALKKWQEKK